MNGVSSKTEHVIGSRGTDGFANCGAGGKGMSAGFETYLTFLSRCHTVNWIRFNASLSFISKMKR